MQSSINERQSGVVGSASSLVEVVCIYLRCTHLNTFCRLMFVKTDTQCSSTASNIIINQDMLTKKQPGTKSYNNNIKVVSLHTLSDVFFRLWAFPQSLVLQESCGHLVNHEMQLLYPEIDSPKTVFQDWSPLPQLQSSYSISLSTIHHRNEFRVGKLKVWKGKGLRCCVGVTLWNGISLDALFFLFSFQSWVLDGGKLCSWGSPTNKGWDAIWHQTFSDLFRVQSICSGWRSCLFSYYHWTVW